MADTTETENKAEIDLGFLRIVTTLSINKAVHEEQLRLHRIYLHLYFD